MGITTVLAEEANGEDWGYKEVLIDKFKDKSKYVNYKNGLVLDKASGQYFLRYDCYNPSFSSCVYYKFMLHMANPLQGAFFHNYFPYKSTVYLVEIEGEKVFIIPKSSFDYLNSVLKAYYVESSLCFNPGKRLDGINQDVIFGDLFNFIVVCDNGHFAIVEKDLLFQKAMVHIFLGVTVVCFFLMGAGSNRNPPVSSHGGPPSRWIDPHVKDHPEKKIWTLSDFENPDWPH